MQPQYKTMMSQMILIGLAIPPLFHCQELNVPGADELAVNYAGGRFQVMVTLWLAPVVGPRARSRRQDGTSLGVKHDPELHLYLVGRVTGSFPTRPVAIGLALSKASSKEVWARSTTAE
jgi:hypothetical protein